MIGAEEHSGKNVENPNKSGFIRNKSLLVEIIYLGLGEILWRDWIQDVSNTKLVG